MFWSRPWFDVETSTGSHHVHMIAAQGNGGQKIYLLPQYDLIAVFTGGAYNAQSAPPNTIMIRLVLTKLISALNHRAAKSSLN
jgi:hypothetical protein